ncbi:MAG TPA: ABC transporter permease [Solirubrobacteraceae bacterium]|nr:ABC transporter permease [Solirubrobacteraceae bacterium]
MKLLTDIRLLTWRRTLQLLRNPVWLIVSLMAPLLYLALFTPLLKDIPVAPGLGGNVLDEFLPGILALMAFTSGSTAGFSILFELQAGIVERFRVTPASRLALLLGPLVSGTLSMLAFDLVLIGVGVAFGFHVHVLGLLVLAVLLSLFYLMFAAFSTAVALATKEISGFAAVVNGINLPLMLLAGILLPISLGPAWMGLLAHFNPLYYLVQASRTLALDHFSGGTLWQAFAVLTPLCALSLAGATRVYRRAVA